MGRTRVADESRVVKSEPNRPDLNAAEQHIQAALKMVPYWHYARDILMPQIRAAQSRANLPSVLFSSVSVSAMILPAMVWTKSSSTELCSPARTTNSTLATTLVFDSISLVLTAALFSVCIRAPHAAIYSRTSQSVNRDITLRKTRFTLTSQFPWRFPHKSGPFDGNSVCIYRTSQKQPNQLDFRDLALEFIMSASQPSSFAPSPSQSRPRTEFVFEPLLDSDEAAQLLCIHPKTLQRMARNRQIHGIQVGKLWRFRASDLEGWLKTRRAG